MTNDKKRGPRSILHMENSTHNHVEIEVEGDMDGWDHIIYAKDSDHNRFIAKGAFSTPEQDAAAEKAYTELTSLLGNGVAPEDVVDALKAIQTSKGDRAAAETAVKESRLAGFLEKVAPEIAVKATEMLLRHFGM